MDELRGGTAVVTGAASGIGRALAERLVAEGMRVVVADVEAEPLHELAGSLDEASACVTDVSCLDDVRALADHAWSTYGRVDLVCNNAGVFQGGLLWECSPADLDWVLGVNLRGILHGISAFVPRMIEQGSPGHVVNTASMAGLMSIAYSGPYCISKFAAVAASEALAHDLAAVGAPIGVSVLCPSLVATDIGRSRRNRPADLDAPVSESAAFVERALGDATTGGLAPAEVAGMVVEAVRAGHFLIPTKASFAPQLTGRTEALLDRRLPPAPTID